MRAAGDNVYNPLDATVQPPSPAKCICLYKYVYFYLMIERGAMSMAGCKVR